MAAPQATLLLLLIASVVMPALSQSPADSELRALLSLKASLEDPLGALDGWNSTTPSAPCDWRGVACETGRVSEIRLPRIQLAGRLTEQLDGLRRLRKLSLHSNNIKGLIPRALFRCSLLRVVYLHSNSFSGDLPPAIANLTNLQVLNVARNFISGPIPGALPPSLRFLDLSSNSFSGDITGNISAASAMELLNLSFNKLTGEIPARIGTLQNLRYLWLDSNELYGTLPSAIANCSSLRHLTADGNSLRGLLPPTIGSLPNLQVISLSRNQLTGVVPSSLPCKTPVSHNNNPPSIRIINLGFNAFTGFDDPENQLCSSSVLEALVLHGNHINGVFPVWLSSIYSLKLLDISGNSISGTLPENLGNLTLLEELNVANNSITGQIPASIEKCEGLQRLDLTGNSFSGPIPEFLGRLQSLTFLSLGGNAFNSSIPADLGGLNCLVYLDLSRNDLSVDFPHQLLLLANLTALNLSGNKLLSGEIPAGIGNLSALEVLNVSNCGFSGEIPASIGRLLRLRVVDLSRQSFSGTLPVDLFGLPNLQIVALQENQFDGEVPEGFSSLSSLEYLNLSYNGFSGQIPPTFGFLRYLKVLSLSHNAKINGSIPLELGNCSSLVALELQDNHLKGTIPSELSHLSHLEVLDLSSNNLSGGIPSNLSTLARHLRFLNVSRNHLEGEIPRALSDDAQAFVGGNDGLCGKPLMECESGGKIKWWKRWRKKKTALAIVSVVFGMGMILFVLFCCCCCYAYGRRWRGGGSEEMAEKKRSPGRVSSGGENGRRSSENGGGGPKLVMFSNKITYGETLEATRQFDEENVLSRGKFGVEFKANYGDGTVLSIRRLPEPSSAAIDDNTFRKGAESLGKVKHRNLTVLRGYYIGPNVRLLVYDYMPNGNLATLLQEASHQDGHVLNWPMRHLIALGISRGLAYLHSVSIVHGDVKPHNVMFDADFEAHLTDFGLDGLVRKTPTPESTSPTSVGTPGYTAPEMALTGAPTKEADVYSFGIVLLEILTGRKPVMFNGGDGEEEAGEDIVKWVKRQLKGGLVSELLEPGLLELDPESSEWEEFLVGVKFGLLCTTADPLDRPSMTDVVFMLEGCRVGGGPDIVPSSPAPPSSI